MGFALGGSFVWGILYLPPPEKTERPAQTYPKQQPPSEGEKTQSPDAELTGSTWLTKDAAGFFTFGLVLVGIGQAALFFFQLRYMNQGMKDAATAAKAARDGASAAQ